MKASRHWPLLFVPVSLVPLSIFLAHARGPFYLGNNSDPANSYWFNSLNLLEAEVPGHTDHPDTTLQELGAGVVGAGWLVRSAGGARSDLFTAVLSQSELYLRDLNRALLYRLALVPKLQ